MSDWYTGVAKGRVSRYGAGDGPDDKDNAYENILKEGEKKEEKKKEKLAKRSKKKKVKNISNLQPFGVGTRKKSKSSAKKVDPLIELSSASNGQVINAPGGNTSSTTISSITEGGTSLQETSIVERKKIEQEEADEEGPNYGQFEMQLLGMLDVWDPMKWDIELLCHRRVEFSWNGRLAEFAAQTTRTDLCYKNNTRMMNIMRTKFEELVHFTTKMVEIHESRQKMNVFTPFVIKGRGTSDLPFPVHVVSHCELEADKYTTKADSCNQKYITSPSNKDTDMKVLMTIYPMNNTPEIEIVTDNRVQFTDKSAASSFQLNLNEIDESISDTTNGGQRSVKIKVGSYFEKVLYALAATGFPSLYEMKTDAENLIRQIKSSKKSPDFGCEWYSQLDYMLVLRCKAHVEYIRASIPKYDIMGYKVILPEGVNWTDNATWSAAYMSQLGLLDVSDFVLSQIISEKRFNISMTLDFYYI